MSLTPLGNSCIYRYKYWMHWFYSLNKLVKHIFSVTKCYKHILLSTYKISNYMILLIHYLFDLS